MKLPSQRRQVRSRQHGVVMLVALIVLVLMTLAGIALMRSVSTSGVIAGNLAFQQSATHSSDVGVATAVSFLQGASATALQTSVLSGTGVRYLAYRQDPSSGQSWDNFWTNNIPSAAVNTLAADAAGNTVSYVIHRLCNGEGAPFTVVACSNSPVTSTSGNSQRGGQTPGFTNSQVYYRITARVLGPRNTLSYVQAIVAM